MTAAELIQHVGSLGFELEPRPSEGLAVRPASKLPAELADELRRHKPEILCLLKASSHGHAEKPTDRGWGSIPPYNLALVTVKPNPTPINRDLVTAYLSRQCALGNIELRAWLVRRRADYISMTAGTWDAPLITYAVARDAACWQLARPEPHVCDLLAGLEACHSDIHSNLCW